MYVNDKLKLKVSACLRGKLSCHDALAHVTSMSMMASCISHCLSTIKLTCHAGEMWGQCNDETKQKYADHAKQVCYA